MEKYKIPWEKDTYDLPSEMIRQIGEKVRNQEMWEKYQQEVASTYVGNAIHNFFLDVDQSIDTTELTETESATYTLLEPLINAVARYAKEAGVTKSQVVYTALKRNFERFTPVRRV